MDIIRNAFDIFYRAISPAVFYLTRNDSEKAHELFITFCRALHDLKLDRLVLDNSSNHERTSIKISNAAGFNKDADIPPRVLKYLGFDRVVIGTVTADAWSGNPRPRVVRYPKTASMINWMGLPGIGARAVAKRLERYGPHGMPLTINLAPTPEKKGAALTQDLKFSIGEFRDDPHIDRFELNISCPNTKDPVCSADQKELEPMLEIFDARLLGAQELYLKLSPDMTDEQMEEILSISVRHRVTGFTLTNTTVRHDPAFVDGLPQKGGASGAALRGISLQTQKRFVEKMKAHSHSWKIVACGGIGSPAIMQERVDAGASEIQLYTPMIFSGTRLIRELRKF